jgi:hypothetical protein
MRSRAAFLLVLVLGLSGCGGGSTPLTKAQWISQAEAICTRHTTALNTKIEGVTGNTRGDVVKVIDIVLDEAKVMEGELKALTPPKEDQATIDAIFAQFDKVVDLAKDFRSAAAQGDQSQDVSQGLPTDLQAKGQAVDTAGTQADSLFDAFGAKKCGSESA